MVKYLLFVAMFLSNISLLFSQPRIEKVEYTRKSQLIKSFSFKVGSCKQSSVYNAWKSLAELNGGRISIMGKLLENHTAEDVVFKRLYNKGLLKLYFQTFEAENDSLIVTNAIQTLDEQFIVPGDGSSASAEAFEIMLDLSLLTRQYCVKEDLNKAIAFAENLNRKIFNLKSRNALLEKEIGRREFKLHKFSNMEKSLANQLAFYKRKKSNAADGFARRKITDRQEEIDKKYRKLNLKIKSERSYINEARIKKNTNLKIVEDLKQEIENQKLVVANIQEKLSSIVR